jgi:hypothetical protein
MVRGLAVVTCAVAALALAVPNHADGRPGKVVRLERSAVGRSPRFCQVQLTSRGEPTIYCFGPHVATGEKIIAVSEAQHGVVIRITDVQPYRECANAEDAPTIWIIKGQLLNDAPTNDVYVGLIDGGMDPQRSRLMSQIPPVSGRADGRAVGIDRDGDGSADIAAEVYGCDDRGNLTSSGKYMCYEIWTLEDHGWRRARVDIFHTQSK